MAEPIKEPQNNDDLTAIQVIKEEYEKKLQEKEEEKKKALEEQEKRLEKKHAEQIRALFREGAPAPSNKGDDNNDDDKSFYERVEDKLKQKLKI